MSYKVVQKYLFVFVLIFVLLSSQVVFGDGEDVLPIAPPDENFSDDVATRPFVMIDGEIGEKTIFLNAIVELEIAESMTYYWWQDAGNPELLKGDLASNFSLILEAPEKYGEYYVNLTVENENGGIFTAREILTVKEDEVYLQAVDDYAAWINDITLYEINSYGWYPQDGDLFKLSLPYLDQLVDLGINTVWFTPIFEGEGNGYWTEDYYQIKSWIGSEEGFREFVQTAHEKGIKVVLDLVISHTSDEHPFMKDVKEKLGESDYADYYLWDGTPGASNFEYYYDWIHLPNTNMDNAELREYFIDMAEYWVIEYDIDGYRADVAWGIEQRTDDFWQEFSLRLKNIKPELFLLAEAPAFPAPFSYDGNPSRNHDKSILYDDRFNAAYDWRLRPWSEIEGLHGALKGTLSINQLDAILNYDYPEKGFPLRFIENHDLPRIAGTLGMEKSKLAHTLVFTVPGIPLLYGGAELGQTEQYKGLVNGDYTHLSYFSRLIRVREDYIDNDSDFMRINNSSPLDVYSYATLSADSVAIVVLNLGGVGKEVILNLSSLQETFNSDYSMVDVFDGAMVPAIENLNSFSVTLGENEAKVYLVSEDAGDLASGPIEDLVDESTLLINGDFTFGISGWSTYVFGDQGAKASFETTNGVMNVIVEEKGNEGWHIQLLQNELSLENGKKYELSVTVSAESSRSVYVGIGKNGGDYQTYGGENIDLSSTPKIIKFEFTMKTTDEKARLYFDMGLSDVTVFVDDVVLTEIDS